jgi:hypothetical protein
VPLALSFDAKGIVMLPKDLREETRKAAEAKKDAGRLVTIRIGERNICRCLVQRHQLAS